MTLRKITALAVACGLIVGSTSLFLDKAEASTVPFKDIKGHWAEKSIMQGYEDGLINGYQDGTFRPNDIVTGDQFLAMMYRSFNDGNGKFEEKFLSDVNEYNFVSYEFLQYAVDKLNFDFSNADKGYWAAPFVDLAYDSMLLNKNSNVFAKEAESLKGKLYREDAAYLLDAWTDNYEVSYQSEYSDYVLQTSPILDLSQFSTDISERVKASVLINGLMNGTPEGYFNPNKHVTRAEAITMINRLRDESQRVPFKPTPIDVPYIEHSGEFFILSSFEDQEFYNEVDKYLSKQSGAIYKDNNSLLWFESASDKEEYVKGLNGEFDKITDFYPNISIVAGDLFYDVLSVKVRVEDEFTKGNIGKHLEAILKIMSGSDDVVQLVEVLDENKENEEILDFDLNGDLYTLFNGGLYIQLSRYIE